MRREELGLTNDFLCHAAGTGVSINGRQDWIPEALKPLSSSPLAFIVNYFGKWNKRRILMRQIN